MPATVNWPQIAGGGWPDNAAFAALSPADQRDEINRGLRWAADRQVTEPEPAYRVAAAALHLLDAHRVDDPVGRAQSSFMLAGCALRTGRADEAELQLRRLLETPGPAETDGTRRQAMSALAGLLADRDPGEATRLLTTASAQAAAEGDWYGVADAAVTLGSMLRRRGEPAEAARIYQEALHEVDRAGAAESGGWAVAGTTARLCGNLGNVLTDALDRHDEAAACYERAVALFELAGEPQFAAERYVHRAAATMAAGRHGRALTLLRDGTDRALRAQPDLRNLVEMLDWARGDEEFAAGWEGWLTGLLEEHGTALTGETAAVLVAARVVARVLAGDELAPVRLGRDPRLSTLADSRLRKVLSHAVQSVVERHHCVGLYWYLAWIIERVDGPERNSLKAHHLREGAAIRLAERVREVLAGRLTAGDAEREIRDGPPPAGLAAVPAEPPGWLGLTDPAEVRLFGQLRSLLPGIDELWSTLTGKYNSCIDDAGQVVPSTAARLAECVRLADLVGDPGYQVSARTSLAWALGRQPGGVDRAVFAECRRLMDEAERCAEGLPRMRVRVHITRATLLKEADFGDAATRLAEAIGSARAALTIAADHGLRDIVPTVVIALANALGDYPDATLDQLEEAEQLLRRGLPDTGADGDAESRYVRSAFLNSLGKTVFQIARRTRTPSRVPAAREALGEALRLRRGLGDNGRTLLTLTNLLGVELLAAELGAPGPGVAAVTAELRALAAATEDVTTRGSSLINATTALRKGGHREAIDTGRDAVRLLRTRGPSTRLITALVNLGETYLEFADPESARATFEDAIEVLDAFRAEGGDSDYRAWVATEFARVHRKLLAAQEALGAPVADLWWTVERGANRTLAENMSRATAPDRERALAGLPPETALLQVYETDDNRVAVLLVRGGDPPVIRRAGGDGVAVVDYCLGVGGQVTGGRADIPAWTPEHPAGFRRQLAWIGEHLLSPVLAGLGAPEPREVVVVASGYWANVPWHAVPVGPAPFGERYRVTQAPSAALAGRLRAAAPRPPRRAAFVACDPTGRLRRHITECLDAFDTLDLPEKVVLVDTSRPVTRAVVTDLLRQCDLFHFAGHSRLARGNPGESGLLLSDGLLSVRDLEALPPGAAPALVFLSSCESGRADHSRSEALNLSTVFLQSGVETVIGSGWPVPDEVAARTAREFYAHLLPAGPAEALRRAHRALRETDYWSSFRIQGR